MNELEKAVVQAAIAMTRPGHEPTFPELNVLRNAAWELITGCHECNTDTHRCPGCGTDIGHGDHACPNCTADADGKPTPSVPWAPQREEAPGWVPRTMVDVRPGDTVRMPGQEGTERTVAPEGVLALQHLLHPASTRYNVMPARWSSIEVTFLPPDGEGEPQRYSFAPGMPVEILLAPGEVAAIEMLGWENRVGMIINE